MAVFSDLLNPLKLFRYAPLWGHVAEWLRSGLQIPTAPNGINAHSEILAVSGACFRGFTPTFRNEKAPTRGSTP